MEQGEIMPDKFTKEAKKLLPKKVAITSPENPDAQEWTEIESYNKAREEALPIVADLLKQIDELEAEAQRWGLRIQRRILK